jgi:hypothetical protein
MRQMKSNATPSQEKSMRPLTPSVLKTFSFGLAIAASAALAPSAHAALCDDYVKTAKVQVDANANQQCGFSGPRWTSDLNAHKSFCEGNERAKNLAIINSEQSARQQSLASCGVYGNCDNYVSAALRSAASNTSQHCGFTGPRWIADANAHRAFCDGNKRVGNFAAIRGEEDARQKDLNTCGPQPKL